MTFQISPYPQRFRLMKEWAFLKQSQPCIKDRSMKSRGHLVGMWKDAMDWKNLKVATIPGDGLNKLGCLVVVVRKVTLEMPKLSEMSWQHDSPCSWSMPEGCTLLVVGWERNEWSLKLISWHVPWVEEASMSLYILYLGQLFDYQRMFSPDINGHSASRTI